jgi:hypothetical protein
MSQEAGPKTFANSGRLAGGRLKTGGQPVNIALQGILMVTPEPARGLEEARIDSYFPSSPQSVPGLLARRLMVGRSRGTRTPPL